MKDRKSELEVGNEGGQCRVAGPSPLTCHAPEPAMSNSEVVASMPPAQAPEHTIFVDGTWQPEEGAEPYWADEVQDAAQDVLGEGSRETFSWYHGPNDPRARTMAGRKLYHDAVLPALEREQTVNLVAHSHGGNVVGEMGAYADRRREHVERMHAAASDGSDAGSARRREANASIGSQLRGLGTEAMSLIRTPVEEYDRDPNKAKSVRAVNGILGLHDRRGPATGQMLKQLGREALGLLGDAGAVAAGDPSRFASERDALATARMGDAIFANTPWLSDHANPLDSELLGRMGHMHSFRHDGDMVVERAHQISGDTGRRLSTGREERVGGPAVSEHAWTHDRGFTERMDPKTNHALPVNHASYFREAFGGAIDPERFLSTPVTGPMPWVDAGVAPPTGDDERDVGAEGAPSLKSLGGMKRLLGGSTTPTPE